MRACTYLCKLGVSAIGDIRSNEVRVLGPGCWEELLERSAASDGVNDVLNISVVHQFVERGVNGQYLSHYDTKTEERRVSDNNDSMHS